MALAWGNLLDVGSLWERGHPVPVAIWLLALADVSLCLAGLSAAYLVWDITARGRQMMPVMKWVWPITALYMGPFGIWAYRRLQLRPMELAMQRAGKDGGMHRMMEGMVEAKPFWQRVFTGVTHCGAGCTLGDLIGEFLIFGLGATLLGTALYPEYFADYFFAYALGIAFQYFSIAPMRGHHGARGIWEAVKADTLSLTAFEIGLFGWMALFSMIVFHDRLHPDSPVYWFMMQIGMVLGFATSFPVNWFLLRSGTKEPM